MTLLQKRNRVGSRWYAFPYAETFAVMRISYHPWRSDPGPRGSPTVPRDDNYLTFSNWDTAMFILGNRTLSKHRR